MINRIKLALKIILGYKIIVYEENTKKVQKIKIGLEEYKYLLEKKEENLELKDELKIKDEELERLNKIIKIARTKTNNLLLYTLKYENNYMSNSLANILDTLESEVGEIE